MNSGSHKKKFAVAFMTASDATFFLGFTDCVVLLKKFYEVGDTMFFGRKRFFLAVCLSKQNTKVPEVVFVPSL